MLLSADVLRISIVALGHCLIYVLYFLDQQTFPVFIILYSLLFFFCQPTRVLSPLTMLYLYYGAWFIFAPATAPIYIGQLKVPEYRLSFAFAFSVFSIAALSLVWGERLGRKTIFPPIALPDLPSKKITPVLLALYALSTAAVLAVVVGSGGFKTWISNPGDAFLNRSGTGAYVILSHFSSLLLAMITGVSAYRWKRYWLLVLFCAWVAITSPVHGSKMQISLLLILSFSPWLVSAKFWSWKLAAFLGLGVAIFVLGMLFRHQNILSTWETMLSTANYFTALQNLAISIRDFEPDFITTFFLPFNKIWITLGWIDSSSYFDMNHMLTDTYYPDRWAMLGSKPIDHVDLLRQIGFKISNQWIGGLNEALVLAVGRAMGGH